VERRVLATAGQVSAIAALALSRALLLQSSLTSAATDGLTGLPNRRAFDQFAARLAAPQAPGYAVILVDIDHFKAVNDTYGHQSGDEVLLAVAAALQSAAPPASLVARYGGEEFVVVMPNATAAMALGAAEQLRLSVQRAAGPVPVTASFGIAASPGGQPAAPVIAAADAALYQAKSEGRNRVIGAHENNRRVGISR
jgi:two-component system cell cycle response regulator